MVESYNDYSYNEYDEKKNKVPWKKIILLSVILIIIVALILFLLKSCGKTNLREGLIEAAKDYYEKYPDLLPSNVGECTTLTLEELEKEGLINSKDYETCEKKQTYVNICYLESKTYHYSAILECEVEDTNYGMWQDGNESDLQETSDVRFKFLGEMLKTGTKYYYPNDLTDASKVIEYYSSIPNNDYVGGEDEQIGYKWYTEKQVASYWEGGKYSSTQPEGYPTKGSSTTVTKYSDTKPSSASYREIKDVTLYRTQSIARPYVWVCVNPNNPNDAVTDDEPCHGTHSKTKDIRYTCNGVDEVKVTAEQIINRDFPSCGDWSSYTTNSCKTNYLNGVKCESKSGYEYTDTMWKWYKMDNVRSYYPSNASTADKENTYYITSPSDGYVKDETTKATVHKYYKLVEDGVANNYEEWLPLTNEYVTLSEMLASFRENGYEVYSLSEVNKIDEIRYQFKLQYRNLDE